MTIHPIRTGSVRVRRAQRERRTGGLLRVLTDREWTGWLPILAWLIDHPEGPIVVDTGETARAAKPGHFPGWHPYYRRAVEFRIDPEEEIGPRLRGLGLDPGDVRRLVLTHFHTDHTGGLHHFPGVEILASGHDYGNATGLTGRLRGYLPGHWPSWFAPVAIDFADGPVGAFHRSRSISASGDVRIVPTPGHTPGHVSVLVQAGDVDYLLAGDTSYTQRLLLERTVDGVSPTPTVTRATLDRILAHAASRPLIYLPSHDPESIERLRTKEVLYGDRQVAAGAHSA